MKNINNFINEKLRISSHNNSSSDFIFVADYRSDRLIDDIKKYLNKIKNITHYDIYKIKNDNCIFIDSIKDLSSDFSNDVSLNVDNIKEIETICKSEQAPVVYILCALGALIHECNEKILNELLNFAESNIYTTIKIINVIGGFHEDNCKYIHEKWFKKISNIEIIGSCK